MAISKWPLAFSLWPLALAYLGFESRVVFNYQLTKLPNYQLPGVTQLPSSACYQIGYIVG
jgi:hypothetical protein